jgi:succinate dehydrogenase / fumarate reductase, cytochrome b subunit
MAKVEARSIRPLSPHLQIFRSYVNMMMSIMHRITGAANYFGILIPAIWLVAAALGQQSFSTINGLFGSPLGLLVLFGYSWSLIHHAIGGIRHFIWDTGRGFSIGTIRALSWLTVLASLTITAAIWFLALIFVIPAGFHP